MYKHVRTLAFEIAPEYDTFPLTTYSLSFPDVWKSELKRLIATATGRKLEETAVPIRSLNSTLRVLVPDLISISRNAGNAHQPEWLSSTQTIPPSTLGLIIQAWIRHIPELANSALLNDILAQITPDLLSWNSRSVDLAQWNTNSYGTAEHPYGGIYALLPDYIASFLSRDGLTFEFGDEGPRALRRVPIAPGENGAELVSWPPFWLDTGKTRAAWSVFAAVKLQTIPFYDRPVVYIDLGVRRWASDEKPLRFAGAVTTYLSTQVPWIGQSNNTNSLHVAKLHWTMKTDMDGNRSFTAEWEDRLPEILRFLNPQAGLLNADELVASPIIGLTSTTDIAAISYSDRMKTSHTVGKGLMPSDRLSLIEQIAAHLPPLLRWAPLVRRVPFKSSTGAHNTIDFKASDVEKKRELRRKIAFEVGTDITIEIHYQESSTLYEFVDQICLLLGVNRPAEWGDHNDLALVTPELRVCLVACALGKIGSPLERNPQIKSTRDRFERATLDRVQFMADELPIAETPTLALVELDGPDKFPERGTDPKSAIRAGFARTGRHSQFFEAASEVQSTERVRKAVLDGFRHLGLRPSMPEVAGAPSLDYCAIWFVKQNKPTSFTGKRRIIPLLVHINGRTGETSALVDREQGWVPYRQALLELGKGNTRAFDRDTDAFGFIERLVEQELLPDGDLLLMCDAHNARRIWPWWTNKSISCDAISFSKATPRAITFWKGLRVVRVRSSEQQETPGGFAIGDDGGVGFTKGIFRHSERVFFSVSAKPVQFKTLSNKMSKFQSWKNKTGVHDASPRQHAWNPALIEVTIAAVQKDDNADKLSTLVDQLRYASIQYDEATSFPLPLHLAELMEEYILDTQYEDDEEGS